MDEPKDMAANLHTAWMETYKVVARVRAAADGYWHDEDAQALHSRLEAVWELVKRYKGERP